MAVTTQVRLLVWSFSKSISRDTHTHTNAHKHTGQISPFNILVAAAAIVQARLAQSAERKALNLVVVGSSPTVGVFQAGRIVIRAHMTKDM